MCSIYEHASSYTFMIRTLFHMHIIYYLNKGKNEKERQCFLLNKQKLKGWVWNDVSNRMKTCLSRLGKHEAFQEPQKVPTGRESV